MIALRVDTGPVGRILSLRTRDLVRDDREASAWPLVASSVEEALHRRIAGGEAAPPAPVVRVASVALQRVQDGAPEDRIRLLFSGHVPGAAWCAALVDSIRRLLGATLIDEGVGPIPQGIQLLSAAVNHQVVRFFVERPDGIGRLHPRIQPPPLWWDVQPVDKAALDAPEVYPVPVVGRLVSPPSEAARLEVVGYDAARPSYEGTCVRCGGWGRLLPVVTAPLTPSLALLAALGEIAPAAFPSPSPALRCATCGAEQPDPRS